jgi:NRPS condensation-like uncharacterized protein
MSQVREQFSLRGSGGAGGHTGILLTSADCFMYTLEKHMIGREEGSTNVCHYLLELEGKLDVENFRERVMRIEELRWLTSLEPAKTSAIAIPEWTVVQKTGDIPVLVHHSDDLMPNHILNQKIKPEEHQLRFDLVYRSNGNTGLIFSWHHLIMDGYAVVLLLTQLAAVGCDKLKDVIDQHPKEILGPKQLVNAARAKFFIDRISRRPLSSIAPKKKLTIQHQKVKTIQFSPEETASLDKLGLSVGARFGRSPLYLAACARSIYQVLQKRGVPVKDFWIPVPKDLRKKGAEGPLLGNHTSFLFYRLRPDELTSFPNTVQSINNQMMKQVKSGVANDYDILMRYLRRTPTPLYYFWIKGLRGGTLASFLFTVAADHPPEFVTFQDQRIIDAWSFPSGVYPPGLSFAFMRFQNQLQLMINYFEGVITDEEGDVIASLIKNDLLFR